MIMNFKLNDENLTSSRMQFIVRLQMDAISKSDYEIERPDRVQKLTELWRENETDENRLQNSEVVYAFDDLRFYRAL